MLEVNECYKAVKEFDCFETHSFKTCSFLFSVCWSLQIHGNAMQRRILHGNSPLEIIEHFTEAIGRPPELPEWVISGAVVGMQGGTETVRHVWDKLKTYKVPISAFWLQVMHSPLFNTETDRKSQLWYEMI